MTIADNVHEAVREMLRLNVDHARQILSGAASEAWLLAEARAFMNWHEPPLLSENQFVGIEEKKRDFVIFEKAGFRNWTAICAIETKLIFASYSRQKVLDKLFNLRAQVCRRAKSDETDGTIYGGIVLAVWDTWKRKYADEKSFVEQVNNAIQQVFDSVRFGNKEDQALRPIVETQPIARMGIEGEIGASTILLQLQTVSDEAFMSSTRSFDRNGRWSTTAEVFRHFRSEGTSI